MYLKFCLLSLAGWWGNFPHSLPSQVLLQSPVLGFFMLVMPPKSQGHNSGSPKGLLTLLHCMNVEVNNLTEQRDSARYLVSLRMFLLVPSLIWLGGVKYPLPFPTALPFFTRTQWKKIWAWFEDYLLILIIYYILFYVQKTFFDYYENVRFGVFSLHLSDSNCLLSFAYKNKSTYSSTTFNNADESLCFLFYCRAQL